MNDLLRSFGRALTSVLHPRMLWLTLAPFLGATIFETVRSYAYEYSPNTWQMVLGITMLLVIMFLPDGLWSVFARRRKAA